MSLPIFVAASIAEIAGCFAFWTWWRSGGSPLWLIPGLVSLAAFAMLLTFAPTDAAGRAYAAYGGIYVASAVVWMWLAEGQLPDRWDLIGACVTLAGTAIIALGPRG